MYLTRLSLTDFRAFARLDMEVPRRILLLVGDNAQGKTSLLEAVYYLATFTSLHAQSDRQLIHFLAAQEALAVGRITAEFQRGGRGHRLEVRLILENSNGSARLRREILVDGIKRTAQEAVGFFNAVIFLPQMTRVADGSPEERRRYLNLLLSQAHPGYAQALSEYQQVLTQRNALLKQLGERGGDNSQLDYWDGLLVERGATLIYARNTAISEMERLAAQFHGRLTRQQEVLRIFYQPAYDPLEPPAGQYSLPLMASADRSRFSREDLRRGFQEKLAAVRGEEIARGVTTIGPHRDEVRFVSNGIDLGSFGSRGQVRTLLLSLKLAEVAWLKDKTGEWPVLLLDEILAELDVQRRADLLEALGEGEQSLMTTTDLNLFDPAFIQNASVWRVRQGVVSGEA